MPELTGKVYTVDELAKRLRVDPTSVRRWCQTSVLTEGKDFFVLPHAGKRRIIRFTQEQFDRIVGNPPKQG
jgi:hypothetical protein